MLMIKEIQPNLTSQTSKLPTAAEYSKICSKNMYINKDKYSEPKYICPKCGGGMCKDQTIILTSYPEQYLYECNKCGYTEYQYQ